MDSLFLSLKFIVFRNGRRLAPPISKRYQPPQLPILSGYINNLFWDHPSIGNIFGNILYTEKEPGHDYVRQALFIHGGPQCH